MRRGAKFFNTYNIAMMAVLTAMASVLFYFPHFPIFPSAPFLEVDFSDVPIVFAGVFIHPVAAIIVAVIKNVIGLIHTTTGGVGELSNLIVAIPFAFISSGIVNKRRSDLMQVVFSLIAVVVVSLVAVISNYYIIFPLFGIAPTWEMMFVTIFPFNLIKFSIQSAAFLLLYFVLKNKMRILRQKAICKAQPDQPFCQNEHD